MSGTDKKTKNCFIISAIGEEGSESRHHYEWLRHGIIDPAFRNFPEYDVKSSADIHTPGIIINQIIEHLLDDELVIADMTLLNANVFYEMGIRHTVAKPIIHMMKKTSNIKIPFDVGPYRTITYNTILPSDYNLAIEQLINHINETRRSTTVINPVTSVRSRIDIASTGGTFENAVLDRLDRIEGQVFDKTSAISTATVNVSEGYQRYISGISGVIAGVSVNGVKIERMIKDFCFEGSEFPPEFLWPKNQGNRLTLIYHRTWGPEFVERFRKFLIQDVHFIPDGEFTQTV
ncbi:hypothetical protein [Xanthobacter sp.]|uniref:hypothetical protein n=1 Tax=Xanthobacter sp. TaxID=35809 RepID=UPI0035AE11A5